MVGNALVIFKELLHLLMGKVICKHELLTSLYVCLAGNKIVKHVQPKRIDEVKVLERENKAFSIVDDKLY